MSVAGNYILSVGKMSSEKKQQSNLKIRSNK
jgi:hypothetical protein